MTTVLITGSDGQLGWELQRSATGAYRVVGLNKDALDIADAEQVQAVVSEIKPQLIINAAAYTAVDRAEQEASQAHLVNAQGAGHIALAAHRCKARMIQLSTDFVFDGRGPSPYSPDDPTEPVNVYGASKSDGERQVVESCPDAVILRTAWVYSVHGNNFVKTLLRLLREREEINVVEDQIGTPTWAKGLAEALWRFAGRPELHGMYHWTDAGVASWYDFAVAIQEEAVALGLVARSIPILPVTSDKFPTPAPRPTYGILDKSATWQALGLTASHWRASLRAMLTDLKRRGPS